MFRLFHKKKKNLATSIPMAISYAQRLRIIVGSPLDGFPEQISEWLKEKEKPLSQLMIEYGLSTDQAMRLQHTLYLLDELADGFSSTPSSSFDWANLPEVDRIRHKEGEYLLMFVEREDGGYSHHILSTGSKDVVLFPTLEQMEELVHRMGGKRFVIIHNHPSGEELPSEADYDTTRRISRYFKETDIEFFDHIIVARGHKRYSSMRENGALS